ncbi:MAG: methyltransferase regulatory domain-containing protein, partial [Pseudomonadota bacterium]
GSEFLGVDLAEDPIARGRGVIRALGLENIRLLTLDLMDFGPSFGAFDYIIAHGLYAWVPEPVRDRILAIAKAHLAPHGVAFVSYNANPAGRLRQAMREMMLYHAGALDDPMERVARGLAFLEFVSVRRNEPDPYVDLLRKEVEELAKRRPPGIYHDELSDVYWPVYFHEFVDHAAGHGLQYLSEAVFSDMQAGFLPAETQQKLREISGGDVLRYEQYLDFMKFRKFRQTLLCHADVVLNRSPEPAWLRGLFVSSRANRAAPPAGSASGVERFETSTGASVVTNHPLVKAVLGRLIGARPKSESFQDLLALGEEPALAGVLLQLYGATLLGLHAHQPPLASAPGERPEASRLARFQARTRRLVTTLLHNSVTLEDELSCRLLQLLDGTRNRGALLDELSAHGFGIDREIFAGQLE